PLIARRQATLIMDADNKLVGIITRGDILRVLRESMTSALTVIEAGETKLIVAYSDESLHEAAARMLKHDIARLPVVDREDQRKVVGYLGRAAILAAQAKFYEEEEVRTRGHVLPTALEKALSGFAADKIIKKNSSSAQSSEGGV